MIKSLLTEAELLSEMAVIQAESIGWQRLEAGVYLHTGAPEEEELIVEVVGIPDIQMAGLNVLLLQ